MLYSDVYFGPHDPAVHNNLGIAFKQLGKLEEAVSSLRQATALKPDLGEAQYNRVMRLWSWEVG